MKMHHFLVPAAAALTFFLGVMTPDSADAAARGPCSGKKGGIARCENGKFVCANGDISKSKRVCVGNGMIQDNPKNQTNNQMNNQMNNQTNNQMNKVPPPNNGSKSGGLFGTR